MKYTKLCLSLILLAMCCVLGQSAAFAQGSNVKVVVNFDNPVHVGNDQVLAPGQYTFHLVQDQTDRDVFRVQAPDGKNVTLTSTNFDARTNGGDIPTQDPGKTTVLVENVGGNYYLHRISLGGQNRGFEFPLPSDVRDRVNNSTHVVIPASGGNAQ
jgi:hypothetical protein